MGTVNGHVEDALSRTGDIGFGKVQVDVVSAVCDRDIVGEGGFSLAVTLGAIHLRCGSAASNSIRVGVGCSPGDELVCKPSIAIVIGIGSRGACVDPYGRRRCLRATAPHGNQEKGEEQGTPKETRQTFSVQRKASKAFSGFEGRERSLWLGVNDQTGEPSPCVLRTTTLGNNWSVWGRARTSVLDVPLTSERLVQRRF